MLTYSTVQKRSLFLTTAALIAAAPRAAAQQESGAAERPTATTLLAGADVPEPWAHQVRAALREAQGVRLRLLRRASPVVARSPRDRVVGAVAEIERSFRSADFASCVRDAEQAALELGPPLAEIGQLRQIVPVWALAAACELKRRAIEAARARAALVLALDPEVRIDRSSQSPDVVRLFDDVRDELASRPPARLTLRASVPDARLEVDGRPIEGRGADVAPGPHLVVARAMGARTVVREVVVGEATEMTIQLEPADAPGARAQLGPETRSTDLGAGRVRAAAIASGARLVVTVAAAQRGNVKIELWQVVGVDVSLLGRADGRPPEPGGWSDLVGDVHPLLHARRGDNRSDVPWWVWVTAGAVVTAAGIVIAVVARPEDEVQLKSALYCLGGDESCVELSELFDER